MTPHKFYLKYFTVNGKKPIYRDADKYYFEAIDKARREGKGIMRRPKKHEFMDNDNWVMQYLEALRKKLPEFLKKNRTKNKIARQSIKANRNKMNHCIECGDEIKSGEQLFIIGNIDWLHLKCAEKFFSDYKKSANELDIPLRDDNLLDLLAKDSDT